MSRRKLRTAEFAEAVSAETMAMKLSTRIEQDQRRIAEHCSRICPLNTAGNLLDKMRELLADRRYDDIHTLVKEWDKWQCQCETLVQRVRETQSWIKAFCEFYEETNSVL